MNKDTFYIIYNIIQSIWISCNFLFSGTIFDPGATDQQQQLPFDEDDDVFQTQDSLSNDLHYQPILRRRYNRGEIEEQQKESGLS